MASFVLQASEGISASFFEISLIGTGIFVELLFDFLFRIVTGDGYSISSSKFNDLLAGASSSCFGVSVKRKIES